MENCKTDSLKTWSVLRQTVRDLRRQLSCLASRVPSTFTFRKLTEQKTRIYFLCASLANGRETILYFTDILLQASSEDVKLLWQPLIDLNFQVLPSSKMSREEQLLWERKRLVTTGITSYEIQEATGRIVFPAANSVFQCLDMGTGNSLHPVEIKTGCTGARLNAQICPHNPDLLAFVNNNDLWVTHNKSGSEKRLTFCHKQTRASCLANNPLSAGIPSYVMQEEFGRFQGCWWRPSSAEDGSFAILYEEVDESDVEIIHFPSPNGEITGMEEYRFPRAGMPNAKSNLKLVTFRVDEQLQIVDITNQELPFPLHVLFPWAEYLVRVGFIPTGDKVWIQLLDRKQQKLDLVLVPLEWFGLRAERMAEANAMQTIFSVQSQYWIHVHDMLYFLPSKDPHKIEYIWASEETGFRHLYYIKSFILKPNMVEENNMCLPARVMEKVQLTNGNWEVLDKWLWVDERHSLVYFVGLRESSLEQHLYVTSWHCPGEIKLLTKPGYSHTVAFSKDCDLFTSTFSNIQCMPACQLFAVYHNGSSVHDIQVEAKGFLLEPSIPGPWYQPPELFSHTLISGDTLYGMIFRPHQARPGKKYPTVLNIYGGPEVQLVTNTFKGMRHLRLHMLAALGYCVVCIDSRGSQNRGIEFESYIKGRMGTVELDDQIEVLHWLAETSQCIDEERLAVHGWSYGGYLSLMGLAQYSHVFKVAIAGAPVTSWTLYDTGYTERYMDLPSTNSQGYKAGSVLTYVQHFPEEENRLLIIHGLIDENVHFIHTSQLIQALVKAGKPYQLQVYPNERHSLRHLEASEHYETMLLSFLQNHL